MHLVHVRRLPLAHGQAPHARTCTASPAPAAPAPAAATAAPSSAAQLPAASAPAGAEEPGGEVQQLWEQLRQKDAQILVLQKKLGHFRQWVNALQGSVSAVNPTAIKNSRRVYVGGVPPGTTDVSACLLTFLPCAALLPQPPALSHALAAHTQLAG